MDSRRRAFVLRLWHEPSTAKTPRDDRRPSLRGSLAPVGDERAVRYFSELAAIPELVAMLAGLDAKDDAPRD